MRFEMIDSVTGERLLYRYCNDIHEVNLIAPRFLLFVVKQSFDKPGVYSGGFSDVKDFDTTLSCLLANQKTA